MNEHGWIRNDVLITVLVVLAIIALVVFLIANMDINVKG